MWPVLEALLLFVALYPVVTAAMWVAGGVMFRLLDEDREAQVPDVWPGVTVLIPAYNEEAVIAASVTAALASEYAGELELIVLDDGSTDDTARVARAAGGDRCQVIRDDVNRGKAAQLNAGFGRARHALVVVTDADTHLHPQAVRRLVERMTASPMLAAVAGAPHVTNRGTLLLAMQVLEAASIIGLIRRTHSLTGRVGTVAGVLGMFDRDRVLAVGGYDGKMATEDIDLTWRLLIAGWETAYEPRALVGMEVPSTLRALWAQRKRWARGQGEVLHEHAATLIRWRHHRLWLLSVEAVGSLVWVLALSLSLMLAAVNVLFEQDWGSFGFALAWGVAISVIATIQLAVALALGHRYDRWEIRAFLIGPIYPLLFWIVSACAALHSELDAVIRGPRSQRVVWDIPREELTINSGESGEHVVP